MNNLLEGAAEVDGIPVVWIQPGNQDGDARIALWLPWLTGTKETAIPFLRELAGRGFTAVSLDPWQHASGGPRPPSRSLPGCSATSAGTCGRSSARRRWMRCA